MSLLQWRRRRLYAVQAARARLAEPFAQVVQPFSERELSAPIEMATYEHQRLGALVALISEISVAGAQALTLQGMLQVCAESMVRNLEATFARIWLVDPSGTTLLLKTSAGIYTHLDGPHGRVPIGECRIGLIAQARTPQLTNDLLHEPGLTDPEWARREGMVAFAGYPLMVEGTLLGVMATFFRRPFPDGMFDALTTVASAIAVGIHRKQIEADRDKLLGILRVRPQPHPPFTLGQHRATGTSGGGSSRGQRGGYSRRTVVVLANAWTPAFGTAEFCGYGEIARSAPMPARKCSAT